MHISLRRTLSEGRKGVRIRFNDMDTIRTSSSEVIIIYCLCFLIGWMKIKNSPDFESKNQYSLLIEAADNGSPPKAAYAHVTVIIEDVNDHKPQFNQSEYNFNVSEGAPVRGSIGSVYAVDRDSGPRGRVVYTIKGGDGSAFTIDGNTGEKLCTLALEQLFLYLFIQEHLSDET